ncbi:MAG: hypothetical protein NVS2B12_13990 [Ktedonobacteraceae bacterium]
MPYPGIPAILAMPDILAFPAIPIDPDPGVPGMLVDILAGPFIGL